MLFDREPYNLFNVAAHLCVFDLFTLIIFGKYYNSEGHYFKLKIFNRRHTPTTNAQYIAPPFSLHHCIIHAEYENFPAVLHIFKAPE
jgi:hypothetical protein